METKLDQKNKDYKTKLKKEADQFYIKIQKVKGENKGLENKLSNRQKRKQNLQVKLEKLNVIFIVQI